MLGGNKRPQLRRCANCGKVGHNRSRCPVLASPAFTEPSNNSTNNSVKFYIHHVTEGHNHSPHIINLKTNSVSPVWQNIEANKPSHSPIPHYHFYHEQKEIDHPKTERQPTPKPVTSSPIKLPGFWQNFTENFTEKKQELKKELKDKLAKTKKNTKLWFKHTFRIERVAIAISIFILTIIIPTQARSYFQNLKLTADRISNDSTAGFMNLQESANALLQSQLPEAQKSLVSALENFDLAINEMQNNHRVLQKIASLIPLLGSEVESRQKLITAGQKIAMGNTYLLKGISDSQTDPNLKLTDRLAIILTHLKAALPNYNNALADFNQVDIEKLPFEYQNNFRDFKILFTSLVGDLKNISALGSSLQEIFGGQGQRRYLLVFQNPYEIRPTGGFMGSFAIIDIKDGKIIKMEVPAGGSYDLQGQLNKYVEPPAPLLLSNKRWEFQDANWFPDFPASSEKILWFYQHARGQTADGVIAINATVLERLLSIVGPITDNKRAITLTSTNALSTIQQIVEEGPEKAKNKPKQIIADLANQFLQYLENIRPQSAMPILVSLQEALNRKEIQAYFIDDKTEEEVKTLGWGGQILPTSPTQDFLLVANANIRGQKSDAQIKQTISHQAVVETDGTITDTVLIRREHVGKDGEKLYGQTNVDYIRVYVPEGSKLISASGFTWPNEASFKAPEKYFQKDEKLKQIEKEVGIDTNSGTRITQEFNKTAFGNWIITEPGEISQVQFTYRLPFKLVAVKNNSPADAWKKIFITADDKIINYQLIAQKQSGVESSFDSQIIFNGPWEPVWQEGKNMKRAANGALIESMELDKDTVWSLIVKNKN